MGFITVLKRSPWTFLLVLMALLNTSDQTTSQNHIEDSLEYLKYNILGKIDEIRIQGSVILEEIQHIKQKLNTLDSEILILKSNQLSHETILLEGRNILDGAINNITLCNKEISTKIDSISDELNQVKEDSAVINTSVEPEALPHPPSSLQISDIRAASVHITWNYTINSGDISHYVIQYKIRNTDQDYIEISDIVTKFYTVTGLTQSTDYVFHVLAVHKNGRGLPSEPLYVTTRCGGEYNSSTGMIRHPISGDKYGNDENCTWIIRTSDRINITFLRLDILDYDYLMIRDGESTKLKEVGWFTRTKGSRSVNISTNTAHLQFKSNHHRTSTGFELQWEPLVETFYQVLPQSTYEVRFNFSVNPRPTALEWSYGANFQEMPNIIQVPSDNGKFSTSLIDLEDDNYQALLRITGITEVDLETRFKLHVSNDIGETYYSVRISAYPRPPSSLEFSNINDTSVQIMWSYNVDPGDISYYVIQYKPKNTNQDYAEISDCVTKFYNVTGLMPATEYAFHVTAVNKIGRGTPSKPSYVTTNDPPCGGEYNSSSGMIRHPYSSGEYQNDENCTWIIRASERINISFVNVDIDYNDYIYVRDGDSFKSKVLLELVSQNDIPWPVQTNANAAHLSFTSNGYSTKTGFKLHWEPAVETFYQVRIHSDYEVRLNFSANPQPTALKWSYGANFQEMPNFIQVPSDNGKFSASLIDLENGTYQALLRIAGITEEDIETKFKLHVGNEIGETYYRAILSALPHPPSSLQFDDVTPTSIRIKWNYNVNPRNISYYVIQYKLTSGQNYTEISVQDTMFYNIRGLKSGQYQFHVLAVDQFGRGPPSEPSYVRTSSKGCGGEYDTSSGKIIYPLTGRTYYNNRKCTWIIRTTGLIKITFVSFDISEDWGGDYLHIRDGDNIDSKVLGNFTGNNVPRPVQTTTNAAHLLFTSNELNQAKGFELYWEPVVEIFYQIPMHSNYDIKLNFSAHPQPTALKWSYGANFQDMPNLIQVPSDNGKFSTSLIDLENGNYQALLRIVGITEEDLDTKFKLRVTNEIAENNYTVILSASPPPPSSVQISNIMPTSVRVSWNYDINPGNISYYVIKCKNLQYIPDNMEISGIPTKFFTVRYLNPSTEYELQVMSANKNGPGLPSYNSYFKTSRIGCGGEYTNSSGIIRLLSIGRDYQNEEKCIWKISAPLGAIHITFVSFNVECCDYLYIRDGESIESKVIGKFRGDQAKSVHTSTNAAHLLITSSRNKYPEFELHWEFTDAPIQTFFDVHLDNDYEMRLNFSAYPKPTALEWSYGTSFHDMPNIIQVPSDDGKFSTSLIELEYGKYQAVLRITGITVEEFESKFNLHVVNEIAETNYKVTLSDCPEGSIVSKGSSQCFKYFKDKERNNEEAKAKCADEGLRLAKPTDAVALSLRKDLIDTYGDAPVWLDNCNWLDDCHDWSKFAWELIQPPPDLLPTEQHMGLTRDTITTDHCLAMMAVESVFRDYPSQPYIPANCSEPIYTLCEA